MFEAHIPRVGLAETLGQPWALLHDPFGVTGEVLWDSGGQAAVFSFGRVAIG
jgi:hypothetical protein